MSKIKEALINNLPAWKPIIEPPMLTPEEMQELMEGQPDEPMTDERMKEMEAEHGKN